MKNLNLFVFVFLTLITSTIYSLTTDINPDDIQDVTALVRSQYTPPVKDEFETAAEFQDKLEKFKSRAESFKGKQIAISLEKSTDYIGRQVIDASYQIETGSMNISISMAGIYSVPSIIMFVRDESWEHNSLFLKQTSVKKREYEGQNSYGAKVLVSEYEEQNYGIRIQNIDEFKKLFDKSKYDLDRGILTLVVKLNVQAARDLKSNLGILLICRPYLPERVVSSKLLDGGYPSYSRDNRFHHYFPDNRAVYTSTDYKEAKIDSPTERSISETFLNITAKSIIVYNKKTKEIVLQRNIP